MNVVTLEKLWAENFKSFGRRSEAPLSRLTLLIGPNNAGKSNLLEVPHLIRNAHWGGGNELVVSRREMIRVGTDSMALGIEGKLPDGRPASLNFSVTADGSLGYADSTEVEAMRNHIQAYEVFCPRPDQIALPSTIVTTPTLGKHGENAAAVLDYLRDLDPQKYESLQQGLRRSIPELERVVSLPSDRHGPGSKEIVFVERGGVRIPSVRVSEGLRLLTFFLLIVHQPRVPGLFAIEEIEHGLHPRRIKDVVGFLRDMTSAPGGPQIIITSHSPLVLDEFRDASEEVVIVERGKDGTMCTRLSDRLKSFAEPLDASLGELWFSGVLGGAPAR